MVGCVPGDAGRPRRWVVGLVVMACVVVRGPVASAGAIDEATVRVFAIGTVGTETADVRGVRLQVASPAAGHGTGFFVGDSLVVTAQHVIEGARHVVVRLPGKGGFFAARVVVADKDGDTAVLAVDGQGVAAAPAVLSSAPPGVRSTVFAIGYPLDPTRTQPQSARGIIAGFLENGTVQLDMALNPGNSGGPIVDEHDLVVGMAIARGSPEKGVQGIGWAVPVATLQAAIERAKRGVGDAAQAPAVTSRDSAMVVDELIQQGALHELRKIAEQDSGAAYSANVEQALASLTARIADADLLVYVAAALWNAGLVVQFGDPKDRPAAITAERAQALAARLWASSIAACQRAVQLDREVGARSTFVHLALASAPRATPPTGIVSPSPAAWAGQGGTGPRLPRPVETSLSGSFMTRYNPDTGSSGEGLGVGLAVAFPDHRSVFPVVGLAAASVIFSRMGALHSHTLVAFEAGVTARSGDFDVTAVLAPTWYVSAVADVGPLGDASESAWTLSARAAIAYHFNILELGAGVRFLSGPTVWIEPVTLGVVF